MRWRSAPHGVLEHKGRWHFKKWVWAGKEAGGDEKRGMWREMKGLFCFFCLPTESLLPFVPLLCQSLSPRSIINLMSPVLLKLLLSIILLSWLFTNSIASFWVQGHMAAWQCLTRGKERKLRNWKTGGGDGMGEIAAPPTGRGWQCMTKGKVWCSKMNYIFNFSNIVALEECHLSGIKCIGWLMAHSLRESNPKPSVSNPKVQYTLSSQ